MPGLRETFRVHFYRHGPEGFSYYRTGEPAATLTFGEEDAYPKSLGATLAWVSAEVTLEAGPATLVLE